jgi:hypothetical protein
LSRLDWSPQRRHLELDRLDQDEVESMVAQVTGGRVLPAE